MTPYVEVRALEHRSRRWIALLAGALLVMPVGVLLPGGTSSLTTKLLAVVAITVLAPLLGAAFSRPRELITVDGDAGTIVRRTLGRLPNPRAHVEEWPISAAASVVIEDLGTPTYPEWRAEILLHDGTRILLDGHDDHDLAQDTVDHLVLLGIPGRSRAHARADAYAAPPPTTWL